MDFVNIKSLVIAICVSAALVLAVVKFKLKSSSWSAYSDEGFNSDDDISIRQQYIDIEDEKNAGYCRLATFIQILLMIICICFAV